MLSLHTNAASLSTQNSLGSTNLALSSSMTKLGTGFRVNSAMDDAAGLQIATRLNAQTRGMQVAQKNAQNGISMLQTGEGALNEIKNIMIRMKDLATESANATATNAEDRVAMKAEFDALVGEMDNIIKNTRFGGQQLLDATNGAFKNGATITFQIGSNKDEKYTVTIAADAIDTTATGVGEIDTQTNANTAIGLLETAINNVGALRSELGAAANRLQHTYNNLGNMIQNTKAAEGRIMDVDYATETSNMTSKQMLMQASTSMLKQSNSMSQMVASLLQ